VALLAPFEAVTARLTARRLARGGWRAPVPVICCGNATVGGAGKTTLALDLGQRLVARGMRVGFVTRGYRGSLPGVVRVDPARHTAAEVGDEPLLLAEVAPTWRGADREQALRAAVAAGMQAIVADDGLQNPAFAHAARLLVVDGESGFGNLHLLPAGPLRERVADAASRCVAAVLIGERAVGAAALPHALPVLRARLVADAAARALAGRRVVAFAGLARPDKFFAMLRDLGAELVATRSFGDHHAFATVELEALSAMAGDAVLATTPKDAARLPPDWRARVHVAGVGLAWEDAAALTALLDRVLS
jgi:tetraacyldisaccharide 4'-kinase